MAPADDSSTAPAPAVCVMDASGHLGTGLVHRLLQRGYTVHAAVQNHSDMEINGVALNSEKLRIFRSDPFDYQSIVDALKGCSGLFYNFDPNSVFSGQPDDQPEPAASYDEFTADVEVRAAHNVLEACAQSETINKVVFTSSITAIIWSDHLKSSDSDFDERHWSDPAFCRKFKLWHAMSKTLTERTAWALAMDRGVNMVSINAGLMVGPDLSLKNSYLKGAAEMYEEGVFVTVDPRFLVDAHICVYEDVSSYGRYLCFNHVINRPDDAADLARMLAPSAPPPPQRYEQDMGIIEQRISNKKLNKLMVDFETSAERSKAMQ